MMRRTATHSRVGRAVTTALIGGAMVLGSTSCTLPEEDEAAAPVRTTESDAPEDEPAAEPQPTGDTEPEPAPDPKPVPDPDGTYTSSCDYVLGDFSSYTKTGYRFIADAQLKNTGNIGTVLRVKAIWYLSGGGKVVETKEVKVEAGRSKRMGITVQVGDDEIDLHQALGYDAKTCKVTATIVDTFGQPVQ